VADFAETYADRNEADFGLVEQAVLDGRIEAQPGL
jgi:hypothetical protein